MKSGSVPCYTSPSQAFNTGELDNQLGTFLLSQPGIIIKTVLKDPRTSSILRNFLVGSKHILIIGGESGMGKSLFVAELRTLHASLLRTLPLADAPLCVVTWDRTHAAFFEEISTLLGESVVLPQGETHIRIRRLVSGILIDQVRFIKRYIHKNAKIIIEAPLIGSRGERLIDELTEYGGQVQTFIMHSPEMRYESYRQGRLMPTSGQPQAMAAIRGRLLAAIPCSKHLSHDAQDKEIERWWEKRIAPWRSASIIRWSPNDDHRAYQRTIDLYRTSGIRPDVLAPSSLSRYTKNHIESVLYASSKAETLLRCARP